MSPVDRRKAKYRKLFNKCQSDLGCHLDAEQVHRTFAHGDPRRDFDESFQSLCKHHHQTMGHDKHKNGQPSFWVVGAPWRL